MIRRSVAVIAVDGILRRPLARTPITEGTRLYRSLSAAYDLILAADDEDEDQLKTWLDRHSFDKHNALLMWTKDPSLEGSRLDQVSALRRTGAAISLVIEADPKNASKLYEAGFTVMLFLSPAYSRPEWRPDTSRGIPSWGDLTAQVDKEHDYWANDDRIGEV